LAQDGIPVVTVEEATVKGGFGAAVLEYYANNDVVHPVHPIGLPDQFITHGSRPELLHYVGLTAKGLSDVALDLLAKLPKHKVRRKSVNA
jgi:1-deoxy-D-xylulose-5-phosphate synthase